jgi:acyl-CoA dehydrogenase
VIAPHPLARLHFDNVRVPADALIGEPGDGFKVAMSVLDVFRSTVGAAALGFARRALDETLKPRARARTVSARPWRSADGAGPCGRHGARRGCKRRC